jgi:S1-C subfamily serine protease
VRTRLTEPAVLTASSPTSGRASRGRIVAIVAAAIGAGAVAGGAIGIALSAEGSSDNGALQVSSTPVGSPQTSGAELAPEAIYRSASQGVVVITDTQTQSVPATPFTPPGEQQVAALGSGFVVDGKRDVVTNYHVVSGATNVRVGFGGGATYSARVIGIDPSTDVAVVRVEAPPRLLHSLAFADSSRVEVGDSAYAIGNPFGLDRTMTAGIVSAIGRTIQAPNGLTIPDAIQTDAPINHGNSGGPLLDHLGRVIGVNAQIEGGTVDANVGIGFAVPSNTARSVADQLIATGHVEHPWLGVRIETIDPSVAKVVRGLPPEGVTVVAVVKGSPAAKAGLVASRRQVTVDGASVLVGGDSITKVDGTPVASSAELSSAIARHKPGERISLEVVRGSRARTVRVTLGNVPG